MSEIRVLPLGCCPYCDALQGHSFGWGMSPDGWAFLKQEHDKGHPMPAAPAPDSRTAPHGHVTVERRASDGELIPTVHPAPAPSSETGTGDELTTARETIRRLNRRLQLAEAALAEKVAKGPSGGSVSRALLRWSARKAAEDLAASQGRIGRIAALAQTALDSDGEDDRIALYNILAETWESK